MNKMNVTFMLPTANQLYITYGEIKSVWECDDYLRDDVMSWLKGVVGNNSIDLLASVCAFNAFECKIRTVDSHLIWSDIMRNAVGYRSVDFKDRDIDILADFKIDASIEESSDLVVIILKDSLYFAIPYEGNITDVMEYQTLDEIEELNAKQRHEQLRKFELGVWVDANNVHEFQEFIEDYDEEIGDVTLNGEIASSEEIIELAHNQKVLIRVEEIYNESYDYVYQLLNIFAYTVPTTPQL